MSKRSLSLVVQRNILLVPFKGINAGDGVLYAVILHKAGRCNVSPVIDGKQHFFIIPVCCRREYFLAGQLTEICPHLQGKGFSYLCRVAVPVGDVTFDIDIDFLAWIYNLAHRLRVLNATEGGERRKKPILRFSSGISRLPARSGVTPHECSAGVRFPNPKAKFLTCVKGSFCTTKVKAASNRESTTSQIIKSSFPHSRCLHRNHPAT